MGKFSDRNGFSRVEQVFQREQIDEALRRRLWNILKRYVWNAFDELEPYTGASLRLNELAQRIWEDYLNRDSDEFPSAFIYYNFESDNHTYGNFKDYFFKCEWFQVYDFLEFLLQDEDTFLGKEACEALNLGLELGNSAYRIVGTKILEITDKVEMAAITEALDLPEDPVRLHIQTALSFLSDREVRDYRNSIKESISAVEAACRIVSNNSKATLGEALKSIPMLHPAFRNALSSMYGYTNDADGIRHSLMDESVVTYCDAKFFLALCSSFVSYLRAKVTVV